MTDNQARPEWIGSFGDWKHPVPALNPDTSEKLLNHPNIRATYHAMNWVAAQEEGMASIAMGCLSALGGHRPFWRNINYQTTAGESEDQLEIGYWLGLQIVWSYFGRITDGEPLGEPDAEILDRWPYDQSPEQWLVKYRAAQAAKP